MGGCRVEVELVVDAVCRVVQVLALDLVDGDGVHVFVGNKQFGGFGSVGRTVDIVVRFAVLRFALGVDDSVTVAEGFVGGIVLVGTACHKRRA